MDWFFYVVIALLGALAVIDLFVGVSNDAVNFLTNAVGSRAAPFKIIMTVASLGVLFGATFSSGMMDVAKSGVLVPEHFTFAEVIVVFTAVMVTDVLLLNTFNSLGLPTSTTVSIVFELLGGATAMACYKVWSTGAPLGDIGMYVNSGKALAMIMAILISVMVAFVAGSIFQYLFRTLFSFHLKRTYPYFAGLFGGASITAIFYFLVMKGAKGASFMDPAWIEWLTLNTSSVLWSIFLGTAVVLQLGILLFNYNVFRLVILSGTFALAFAFAGNDLVNFVGVPLAALESFQIFAASGAVDPTDFTMGALRESTRTPTYYLLFAGIVMVLTLWFSKKAHRVIRTSVNLSSTARGGKEQFGSSLPARIVVRSALSVRSMMHQLVPETVWRGLSTRFEPLPRKKGEEVLPFDELRASLNLVLAAALIASATSLKLPLSTTYVTFMVAMGSSLADGAWDRESAVYRLTGVMTVISGWFMTAFTAFTACATVCLLFIAWGKPFCLFMMCLALFFVVKSNFFGKEAQIRETEAPHMDNVDKAGIRTILKCGVTENLAHTIDLFTGGMEAFLAEDRQALHRLKAESVAFYDKTSLRRGDYYEMALEGGGTKADRDARNFYYRAYTSMKEASHSLRDQMGVTENYVANCHSGFTGAMRTNSEALIRLMRHLKDDFSTRACERALTQIDEMQRDFMAQIAEEKVSLRKSELYLGYLLYAREVINRYRMVRLLQKELDLDLKTQVLMTDMDMEPVETSER